MDPTTQTATAPLAVSEDRIAWLMVLACAVAVGMGFGAIVNIAVFLTPLAVEFDWSRGDLSLAYSTATISTGIGGIVMGHFADRLPIRRVVLCGAIVPGLALMALSRLDSLAELYLLHAVMGLLGVGAIMAPLNTLAASWFARNPGLAIGVVSAGGALGQGVMPLLGRQLVLVHGWRPAYLMLGILFIVVMLPIALFVRNAPALAQGAAAGQAAAHPYAMSRPVLLGWLCVAVVFCCVCMATPIIHVAALGADVGLGARESAALLTIMMVFGMLGRIAFGKVADRLGNLQAYIIASAGQTLLAFMFPLVSSRPGLFALSALFGLVFSGAMTAFILCGREWAPQGHAGLSIGVVMFAGWVGMAIGGWQGGLFYDLCGTYGPSFMNASVGGIANLMVLALLYQATVRLRRA